MFNTFAGNEKVDHLQMQKLEKIVETLVQNGYYRAEVPALSMFDRCIGGLCWAITASDVAVEIDILFEENMDLGRKIILSEKVEKCLQLMKCPHELLAHQVQGHDFPALLPVIKWLVKLVKKSRRERKLTTRRSAHHHFKKECREDVVFDKGLDFLKMINQSYQTRRQLRRPKSVWRQQMDEVAQVQMCLLEYGRKAGASDYADFDDDEDGAEDIGELDEDALVEDGSAIQARSPRRGSTSTSMFDRKFAKLTAKDEKDRKAQIDLQMQQEEILIQQMSVATDSKKGVRTGDVGRIVAQQKSEISTAAAKYNAEVAETRRLMEEREPRTRRGRAAAFKRRKAGVLRQIQQIELQYQLVNARSMKLKGRYDTLKKQLDEAQGYNIKIIKQTELLAAEEKKAEHADELTKLRSLVALNETLRDQEKSFKENCRRQRAALQAAIAALEDGTDDADLARLLEIEETFEEVSAKYRKGRQLIAKKNRDLQALSRKIDELPTRAELLQYERRFVELYQQVAAKLDETRKYYDTYNTLREKCSLLDKQAQVIQSINDRFLKAMKTKAGKENFRKSCAQILNGLGKERQRKKAMVEEAKNMLQKANELYTEYTEKQRRYLKAVRSFQEACNLNEKLSNKLERRESR